MQSALTSCVGAQMTFKRAVATAVIVATSGLIAAPAFAQADTSVPAEFPPLSYKGRQYVDSRGCVYIRANTGGLVDWIPRVARSREHICNANPTFAEAPDANLPVIPDPEPAVAPVAVAAAEAPAPAAAAPRTRIGQAVSTPAPRVAAVRPAPEPAAPVVVAQTVEQAAPQAVEQRQPRFTLASLFKPRVRVSQPIAPAMVPGAPLGTTVVTAPVIAPAAPATTPATIPAEAIVAAPSCPGGTGISQRYLGSGDGVRCGPQAQSPIYASGSPRRGLFNSGAVVTGQVVAPVTAPVTNQAAPATTTRAALLQPQAQQVYVPVAPGSNRVVPAHVYANQQNAALAGGIPKGYRPIWKDDRLNPKRAQQTLAGKAQMDLIWTQTVPRQLIDRVSGRDVTRHFPGLSYPHTSFAQQDGAISGTATVSSKSHAPATVAPAARTQVKTVAKATNAQQGVKPAYVQVALFAQPGNAQRTAGKLAAKGLPMRIWNAKSRGKPVQLVVAGPFTDAGQARAALSAVRKAGFGDAYLR